MRKKERTLYRVAYTNGLRDPYWKSLEDFYSLKKSKDFARDFARQNNYLLRVKVFKP